MPADDFLRATAYVLGFVIYAVGLGTLADWATTGFRQRRQRQLAKDVEQGVRMVIDAPYGTTTLRQP